MALLIDANIAEDWNDNGAFDDSVGSANIHFLLGLIAAFLGFSFFVCAYVMYRMGVRLWAGPLERSSDLEVGGGGVATNFDSIAAQCQTYDAYIRENYPPSYESCVAATPALTVDEMPPPAYETTIIGYVKKCNTNNNHDKAIALHI